ncbi:Homeobox protein homothorax [Blattella germanica]|nr:Homeobox protein homothorax [Blattella germanica]
MVRAIRHGVTEWRCDQHRRALQEQRLDLPAQRLAAPLQSSLLTCEGDGSELRIGCPDLKASRAPRPATYDDGIHPYTMAEAPPSMYDTHIGHRPMQNIAHHSPHMNHAGMHQYHPGNHVTPVSNHVMGSVPDVHKRDKDAIYG